MVVYSWQLKGDVVLSLLGGPLILFEFENEFDIEWVLKKGLWCKDETMFLDGWALEVGCFQSGSRTKES